MHLPFRSPAVSHRPACWHLAAGKAPNGCLHSPPPILDKHCADVGRDSSQIRRSVQLRMGVDDLPDAQATVDAYVKVRVTDFLLILHGDHPTVAGEQLATYLPALREVG